MFDAVNHLLYKEKRNKLDFNLLGEFSPYVTMKSFSYYDGGIYSNYINETLNMYGGVFENNEDQFVFFDAMIPKLKRKRLDYIKKPKQEKEEEEIIPEFLSKREIEIYENTFHKTNT